MTDNVDPQGFEFDTSRHLTTIQKDLKNQLRQFLRRPQSVERPDGDFRLTVGSELRAAAGITSLALALADHFECKAIGGKIITRNDLKKEGGLEQGAYFYDRGEETPFAFVQDINGKLVTLEVNLAKAPASFIDTLNRAKDNTISY